MKKRADIGWDFIGKFLFVLLIMIVLLIIIGMATGSISDVLEKIKDLFSF